VGISRCCDVFWVYTKYLVTAVPVTVERLASITSKETGQHECDVLRAHAVSSKKLLFQLTRAGCPHFTLRWGLWTVCEAVYHTTDALRCKLRSVFSQMSDVFTGPHETDPTVWRTGMQKECLTGPFGWQCMACGNGVGLTENLRQVW
jgi:hypothetical protein